MRDDRRGAARFAAAIRSCAHPCRHAHRVPGPCSSSSATVVGRHVRAAEDMNMLQTAAFFGEKIVCLPGAKDAGAGASRVRRCLRALAPRALTRHWVGTAWWYCVVVQMCTNWRTSTTSSGTSSAPCRSPCACIVHKLTACGARSSACVTAASSSAVCAATAAVVSCLDVPDDKCGKWACDGSRSSSHASLLLPLSPPLPLLLSATLSWPLTLCCRFVHLADVAKGRMRHIRHQVPAALRAMPGRVQRVRSVPGAAWRRRPAANTAG